MPKWATALYVLLMVAIIVGIDVAFLSAHFWWRLATNVAVVVVFVALYFVFFNHR